uniref:Putative secreted protein n=1 Tax=Panstrongylus lignarius TaxID=156445 RepID=A0A224XW71_9HEMI
MGPVVCIFSFCLTLLVFLRSSENEGSLVKSSCTISFKQFSAHFLSNSFSRGSKEILKQLSKISHILSFVNQMPSGDNINVLKT